jgi:hypothetical protein
MAESAQINPKIALATKVRLVDFCKDRGHSQGEVVEAALEAYLTPADGDTQALLFQKLNALEHGMKDVVTLLGTVIQHLERQTKPPPPRVATAAELYPDLYQPVDPAPSLRSDGEEERDAAGPAPLPRSPWRALFGRRATP